MGTIEAALTRKGVAKGNRRTANSPQGSATYCTNYSDKYTTIIQPGQPIQSPAYDVMGRRCRRQVRTNGTLTRDERYLLPRVPAHRHARRAEWRRPILWDPSEPTATRPLGLTIPDNKHYNYAHDFTKNVTEILDEKGNLLASYEYVPYDRTREAKFISQLASCV